MSRAKNYRKNQAVEVTLPSDAVFLLRRPPLQAWLNNGRAPQYLTKLALDAARKNLPAEAQTAETTDEFTEADAQAFLQFQIDIVAFSMVAPRLITDETTPLADDDDALRLDELLTEDFAAICNYALTGSPRQPVRTREGETTLAAVASFRDGGQSELPAPIGADVRPERGAASTEIRTPG